MKRVLLICALVFALCAPAFAPASAAGKTITVGATPFPHGDILKVAAPVLEKEGYTLEIVEFNDYVQPNLALASGHLDANFFQHIPYLENMNAEKKLDLASAAAVHIEPLGLYSKKITALDELKKGDRIAVPNDPTNEARALRLLEASGLITVKPGELVTIYDIVENPRELDFVELEAAQLPRTLGDVRAAVINTNFAAAADLVPSRDAIVIEGSDSPYVNVIAVQAKNMDSDATKALIKAVQSPEVKAYIENELGPKGIVAAF